jgi:CheY-like chemotaxis protein
MLKTQLQSLGCRVESQTNSPGTLELFRPDSGAFDLVVTDMTMPQMTGLTLIQELRQVRPDIPVVLCAGFSEFVDEAQAAAYGIQALIMKPVLWAQVAEAVRKALDSTLGA